MSWKRPKMSEVTRAVNSTVWDNQLREEPGSGAMAASILKAKAITDEGADVYVYGTMASSAVPIVPPIVVTPALIRSFSGEHEVLIGKQGTDDPGNTTGGGGTDPGGGGEDPGGGGGGTDPDTGPTTVIIVDINPMLSSSEQSGNTEVSFIDTSSSDWPTIEIPHDANNRIALTNGRRLFSAYTGADMMTNYMTASPDIFYRPKMRLVFKPVDPTQSGVIFSTTDGFHIWWDAEYSRILVGTKAVYTSVSASFDINTSSMWCIGIDDMQTHMLVKFGTYSGSITDDPVSNEVGSMIGFNYDFYNQFWVSSGELNSDPGPLSMVVERIYAWDTVATNPYLKYMTNKAQYLIARHNSTIVQPAYGTVAEVTANTDWPKIDLSGSIEGKIYDIVQLEPRTTGGIPEYVIITYTGTNVVIYATRYFTDIWEIVRLPYEDLLCKIEVHTAYNAVVLALSYQSKTQANSFYTTLRVISITDDMDVGFYGSSRNWTNATDTLRGVGYSTSVSFTTNACTTVYKDPQNDRRIIVYQMIATQLPETLGGGHTPVLYVITTVLDVSASDSITQVSSREDTLTEGFFTNKHVECLGIVCKDNTAVIALGISDNIGYGSDMMLYCGAFNVYLLDGQALRNAMIFGDSAVLESTGFSISSNARWGEHRAVVLGESPIERFERRITTVDLGGRPILVDTCAQYMYLYSTGRLSDNYLPFAVGVPNTIRGARLWGSVETPAGASARTIYQSADGAIQALPANQQLYHNFRIPGVDGGQTEFPDEQAGTDGYQVFLRVSGSPELKHNSTAFTGA